MLSLGSLSKDIDFGVNFAARDLGQLRLDVEGEGSEVAEVDGPAGAEVMVEVGHEGSPDDEHLKGV